MFRGTTIVAVRRNDRVAIAGDGQVTFGGNTIMKSNARKVRRLYQGKVIAGFAGSVADAFTLFAKFETKLEEYNGNLMRAAVEMAKDWRMDRVLRRLEAMLVVADNRYLLLISGNGEVIEPEDGITAIGSGGSYALSAARALSRHTNMEAAEIAKASLGIAAEICVFTNNSVSIEEIQ